MRRWLVALLMLCVTASAQTINPGSAVTPPVGTVTTYVINDDGHASVPLPFGFPYYGKTFTHSFMFDNGVVGFFDPTANTGCNAQNNYCGGNQWYSQQFATNMGSQFSYMIAPLWTDLRPVAGTVYSTQGNATQMTYRWENVGEYYNPSNLNTFSLQIKPSGFIGVNYEKINLGSSNVSIGMIGDPSKNEFVQHYWSPAGTPVTANSFTSWNVSGTGIDLCAVDPLSSTTCAGYQQAYLTQQCSANPLYNSVCPGYAEAYFTQQCSISSLYNPACPGYAQAYFTQQCSLDPLYNSECPGYAQAYFNKQCSLDTLYSKDCPGYAEAYFNKQCSLDALYDSRCEGYKTAYATKYLTSTSTTATSTSTTTTTATATNAAESTVPTTVTSSAATVTVVSSTVDSVIKTPDTTSASSPTSLTGATSVIKPAPIAAGPMPSATTPTATPATAPAPAQSQRQTEQRQEQRKTDTAVAQVERRTEGNRENAKKEANEQAKEVAREAAGAKTMEQQVATQGLLVGLIGYVPGFNAYQATIVPDILGATIARQYGKPPVDNRAIQRGLTGASDQRWQQMVDSQYK